MLSHVVSYQRYIDPDSICCVVMDEAHHSVKDHPFFRITKSPYIVPNDEATAVMAARGRKDKDKDKTNRNGNGNANTDGRMGGGGGGRERSLGRNWGRTNRRAYENHERDARMAAVTAAGSRVGSAPRTAADFPKVNVRGW